MVAQKEDAVAATVHQQTVIPAVPGLRIRHIPTCTVALPNENNAFHHKSEVKMGLLAFVYNS